MILVGNFIDIDLDNSLAPAIVFVTIYHDAFTVIVAMGLYICVDYLHLVVLFRYELVAF